MEPLGPSLSKETWKICRKWNVREVGLDASLIKCIGLTERQRGPMLRIASKMSVTAGIETRWSWKLGTQSVSPPQEAENQILEPLPAASQGVHEQEAGIGSRITTWTQAPWYKTQAYQQKDSLLNPTHLGNILKSTPTVGTSKLHRKKKQHILETSIHEFHEDVCTILNLLFYSLFHKLLKHSHIKTVHHFWPHIFRFLKYSQFNFRFSEFEIRN